MIESSARPSIADILTKHVLDDEFRSLMARVAATKSFSCVIYGGRLYDFEYYSNAVGADFEAGVTTLTTTGSGELLSVLISYFLSTHPSYRLFAHDFVSLENPFPSIGPAPAADLRGFVGRCSSMPLNLLIAQGDSFEMVSEAMVAVADISDGDAWLLVVGGK
jgi:hypothetical protein